MYTLGVQPGTTIINNVCHDVWSFNYGGWGYYTDEGSSNITNTHNLVYDTKCAGYHQHYGVDNLMFNNVVGDVNQGDCDGAVVRCTWVAYGPPLTFGGGCVCVLVHRAAFVAASGQVCVAERGREPGSVLELHVRHQHCVSGATWALGTVGLADMQA